jgi:hypothetical protein
MKSLTSPEFWRAYRRSHLKYAPWPAKRTGFGERIPTMARFVSRNAEAFGVFCFGSTYRALAVAVPDGYLWFWIGTHDEYERILKEG